MLWLLAVISIGIVAWMWAVRRALWPLRRPDGPPWLPVELREGELVWSEKQFRCERPVPVVARVDRVYRRPDGVLVPMEFKRRPVARTYLADIVELSVQRYVLRQAAFEVSLRAYVAVVLAADGRIIALPVNLEDSAAIEQRIARLLALRSRAVEPEGPIHPAVCLRCGHRTVCKRYVGGMAAAADGHLETT